MVYVACFGVRVTVMFHRMFVHLFIILLVRFGLPSGNFWEIATRSVGHMFSLSFVYLYFLFISYFGLRSWIWLSIASVHAFLLTFSTFNMFVFLVLYIN